jgi:hypothetical protein
MKISESRSDSRRKMKRPRLKWLEDVENYFRQPKVKRFSEKASNSEEWSCHKGGQGSQRAMKPTSTSILSK